MKINKIVTTVIATQIGIMSVWATGNFSTDTLKEKGKHEIGFSIGKGVLTQFTFVYKLAKENSALRIQLYTGDGRGFNRYNQPIDSVRVLNSTESFQTIGIKAGLEKRHQLGGIQFFYGGDISFSKVTEHEDMRISVIDQEKINNQDLFLYKTVQRDNKASQLTRLGLVTFAGVTIPVGNHFTITGQISYGISGQMGEELYTSKQSMRIERMPASSSEFDGIAEIGLFYRF